jgi:hypothetical protein
MVTNCHEYHLNRVRNLYTNQNNHTVDSERNCNRCVSDTSAGQQCRRRTCVVGPMCWQHTIGHFKVRILPSPVSGRGLFAWDPRRAAAHQPVFRRGDCIVWYAFGQDPFTIPIADPTQFTYAVELSRNTRQGTQRIINAYKTNFFPGRYANRGGRGNSYNAEIKGRVKNVKLIATKNIFHNTEIFVPYGSSYRL